MDTFARSAFVTVATDAFLAALAAMILMVAYSFDPPLALVIGASVAMFFATVMLVRAAFLTEEKVASTNPWLEMQADERPLGKAGLAYARDRLQTVMLAAAKNAAGIASAMFALGLFLDLA
jgi:predicted NBD/HSP70 family sugar kinase